MKTKCLWAILILVSIFVSGCGDKSGPELTVKAVGPTIAGSAAKMAGKTVASGIVFTSWDGTKTAYGVPVYVEAVYTDPGKTTSNVDVIISSDHPEFFDSVTVKTDADGVARTTLYPKIPSTTEVAVKVTAKTADNKILAPDPSLVTMMPSQLKLSSPQLSMTVNVHDYPISYDHVMTTGSEDVMGVFVAGYTSTYTANARFPWIRVEKNDGSQLSNGLPYSLIAVGIDHVTLRANKEYYNMISPSYWPATYPQSEAFYSTVQDGKIPRFTEISTLIPYPGQSRTLELVWEVTVTDPVDGPQVGYIAGTVKFQN